MIQNRRLRNLIRLDHVLRLFVPSTIDVDQDIDTQQYVDEAVRLLSETFGGATTYNAKGGWYTGQRVVYESVTIVETYSDNLESGIDATLDFCERMKTELRQEAIALEIDGELYLL